MNRFEAGYWTAVLAILQLQCAAGRPGCCRPPLAVVLQSHQCLHSSHHSSQPHGDTETSSVIGSSATSLSRVVEEGERVGVMAGQTIASCSSRQKQLTPTASALCQLSPESWATHAGWCSPLFSLENNQKNFINLTSNSFKRAFNLIFDPLIWFILRDPRAGNLGSSNSRPLHSDS